MKRFIRSIAGKTILFLVFLFCFCIAIAGVIDIAVMWSESFYEQTEREKLHEHRYYEVQSMAYSYAYNALINQNTETDPGADHAIVIRDLTGEIIAKTDSAISAMSRSDYESYRFKLYVWGGNEGIAGFYWVDSRLIDEDLSLINENTSCYILTVYLNPNAAINELDALQSKLIHWMYALRYAVYPITLAAVLICVVTFITLICAAGKRPNTEALFPGPFFSVPFDLMLAAIVLLGAFALLLTDELNSMLCAIISGIILSSLLLGLCMSFASRVKQKVLWQNTVIYRCYVLLRRILRRVWHDAKRAASWLWSICHHIPMVWRTALILFGISLLELVFFIGFYNAPDILLFLWFMEKLVLIPVILFAVITMRKLQRAGEAIAEGDLSYQAETNGLFWDFKRHAEHLNSISKGMSQAVEQRLKSERMKTELITNVSHDIKTPLTSVINYAALIGKEECDNPAITEYAGVLTRQSEKLKRLIEDLVEASKASTGNLEVTPVPCDASVFISQADGEYEEKMREAGLTLVTKLPERELRIMADSRRMWRVFDNLMNNICKYAQHGTRVYLSLESFRQQAVITFKNTSRDPLDISADELMERFVRGDASRNTEGNGLGLSIARSLVELQGGTLDIEIDGDLFKVKLTFPTI